MTAALTPPESTRDRNRRLFLEAGEALFEAGVRPTTPGCAHGRGWCDECEDAMAAAAAVAERRRMDREEGA